MINLFDNLKKKLNKLFNIVMMVFFSIVALLLILAICFRFKPGVAFTIVGLGIMLNIGGCLVFYHLKQKHLNKDFKHQIITASFHNINKDFIFDHSGHFTSEEVYESRIFNKDNSNNFISSDMFSGKIANHDFRSADTYIYYVRSTGKSSTTIVLFKGRFYIIDLQKNFNAQLVIREEHNILSFAPEGLKKIDIESISFNKKFNIYTDSPLEALKVIKPQQIERLAALENNHEGRLFMGMRDKKLYFGFWDDIDHFELQNYETLKDLEDNIKKEIDLITEIIKTI